MSNYRELALLFMAEHHKAEVRRLKKEGKWASFLDDLANGALDTENATLESMAKAQPLPENFLERAQELNRRAMTAREVARGELLEFLRSL